MQVTENISELRKMRRDQTGVFGLVPTMGALHAGHASIIRRARLECDHVGVSIFVNPAQFGQGEDLTKYPRTMKNDLALLESLGVDAVWIPPPEFVYPTGYQTWITVDDVSAPLEGTSRPGHFRGVATVVAKLFNIFVPNRAYFGQKDAQQVAVIRRMAADLNFAADIVVSPTVRETDGLAMSSRNAYLNEDERRAAPALYRALSSAKAKFESGVRNADVLRAAVLETLSAEPRVSVQYVSVADPDTIAELCEVRGGALLSAAVIIGKTRLIDNVLL
jgi:pantoate--beta-alanine ligase